MKTRIARRAYVSILLTILVVLVSVVSVFAQTFTYPLTAPGSIKQFSWDPSEGGGSPKWTNGLDGGYWEGDTAVMAAEIVNESGVDHTLPICMQIYEEPAPPTKAYGLIAFEPYNTTLRSPNLPPTALDDATPLPAPGGVFDVSGLVYGVNMTIHAVTAPVVGLPNCNANEVGIVIDYRPLANQGAWLVWGGQIAREGDPLPAGLVTGETVVPPLKSAGYAVGNFQSRIRTSAADKTLTFTVNSTPTAVALADLAAGPAGVPLWGFAGIVLALLVGAAGVVWTYRRAH